MSIISRKNQVTLPVSALRAAGLQPGDDVLVTAISSGHLELTRPASIVEKTAGIFGDDVYPDGYLERLRREWD